jgi:hypothetical protein
MIVVLPGFSNTMAAVTAASSSSLSVVVVILGRGRHLERCLDALRCRKGVPDAEIIVPCDGTHAEEAALRERFPEVKFLQLTGKRTYAELRTAGVCAARGRIVAITEDQCIPPPRWCANILEQHAAPDAARRVAIGGPVDKLTPDKPINWAIYLRELGTYMPPVAEGPAHALTDCNVTYKREALEAIADAWKNTFHEPDVHAALQKNGGTLWLSPALLTMQQREMRLGPALRERYTFGRLYGGLRAAGVSRLKRLALILLSPLLPLLLVARVYAGVFGKGRHIGPALAALPYIVLFALAWAFGELVGYVAGKKE